MGIKVIGGSLYVVAHCDHRVLIWDSLPTQTNQPADRVLGQLTLGTGSRATECAPNAGGAVGPSTLDFPTDVASNGKILAVLDQGNNRVLVFDPIPTSNWPVASYALGASSVTSQQNGGCPNSSPSLSLYEPQAFAIAGSKLVIADSGNNRTLAWDTFPSQPLAPQSVFLGQSSATGCTPPATCSVLNSQTQAFPSGVWTDGTRLFVADTRNDRILLWASFPTAANQAPDLVLGPALAGARSLFTPAAVTSNGSQLIVADTGNNRVLVWNALPTTGATAPDVVLGQSDFASNGGAGGPTGLSGPLGLLLYDGHLWVSDSGDGRVVRY